MGNPKQKDCKNYFFREIQDNLDSNLIMISYTNSIPFIGILANNFARIFLKHKVHVGVGYGE